MKMAECHPDRPHSARGLCHPCYKQASKANRFADDKRDRRPLQDLSWQDQAACAGLDVDVFFVPRGGSAALAKSICDSCPVQRACLEYGLKEPHGIWGGLAEPARSKIRKQRRDRGRAA